MRGNVPVSGPCKRLSRGQPATLSPDAKQACVTERLPLVFDSGRHAAVKLWDTATGEVKRDLSAEKEFKGNHMIVDRLFAAAELRLGEKRQQIVRIVRTDGRPQS